MKQHLITMVAVCITGVALFAGLPLATAAGHSTTVLITGANRGLGLEFARQFSDKGYHVIATARNPGEADELRALGVQVEQLDVADTASVKALSGRLEGTAIDILINNAGISGHGARSFAELEIDKLAQSFQVNSLGPLRVTQALLENLRLGEKKKIISISTIMASISLNNGGAYGYRASKAALNTLHKSLAAELGREGFICVLFHPGWVKTDMGGESAPLSPEQSISSMITLIERLNDSQNGHFLDYQGETIPW